MNNMNTLIIKKQKGLNKTIPETTIYVSQKNWLRKILKNVSKHFVGLCLESQKLSVILKKYIFLRVKDFLLGLSLKTKWIISTLVFIISFSIILVSFFIHTGKKNLEKELEKWGTSLASNLAKTAEYPAIIKDYKSLYNYLVGIMNQQEILYSAMLDDNGIFLAKRDPNWMITPQIQDFSIHAVGISELHTTDGKVYYHIVEPIKINSEDKLTDEQILFDNVEEVIPKFNELEFKSSDLSEKERLGSVVLGVSLENMKIKLIEMRNRAISIASIITLVSICVVFLGVKRMTSPIKKLVQAIGMVAQDDLSYFVNYNRRDELGQLAHSFNEMIIKLKKSRDKVKHY
ncbi:MAG: HAMP domain-containing protein, partial [bacterium]